MHLIITAGAPSAEAARQRSPTMLVHGVEVYPILESEVPHEHITGQ
jgi:hypothetical protein